ncbi:MAG: exosortase/archaeosortase family protein [Phycisphaerae bacterium]|nr:exosortase/archaeosortase family protein [Phycisphaerae bacterium]
MVAVSTAPSWQKSFPLETFIKILVLVAVLALMNYRQFPRLFRDWVDNPNWSHGFIIPLFSLYLLFARREELLSVRRRVCLWGLPVFMLGCALQIMAYAVENPWSCQISMTVVLFGLVLYLGGPGIAKLTWLPIFFLIFAMPIPDIIYNRIALPLQNFAALGSGMLLRVFGVQIEVAYSNLQIQSTSGAWHSLTVAEACSGMRLLMAFMAISVAMAYLEDRPLWQRIIMVGMGIPVAIFCNVLRVTITCVMYYFDHPELGQDFMHDFTGMLMLLPALVMLWLIGLLLKYLFVEVDDEETSEGPDSSAKEAKA